MNENNTLWEEKNLTDQSKKFENSGTIVQKDTINETKKKSVKRECNYIGRTGIVYLINNKINDNKYVGITTLKLNRRWDGHKSDSKKSPRPLYRAIRKYGIKNFEIRVLEKIKILSLNDVEQLKTLEESYIKKYKSFIHWKLGGYNLTEGGEIENRSCESVKQQAKSMKIRYAKTPNLALEHSRKMTELYANSIEMRQQARDVQIERYKNSEERFKTSESIKNAYKNNPALGRRLSVSQTLLNKNHPEKGRMHSLKIRGHNHPCYDDTIYKFKNETTNELYEGTKYDFRKKYNLSQSKISLLTNGKRRMHKNWILQ